METLELVLRKPAAGPFGLALQSHGKDPGVKSATPGSNAQQGGLTAGDTIVSINGQNVTGFGITQAVKALREVTGEFKMVVRRRASGVPAALRGKEEPRAPTVAESNKRESPASTLPECAAHASAIAGTSKSHERDEMHSPESPPTIPDGPLPTDSNEYLPATGIEAHTIVPATSGRTADTGSLPETTNAAPETTIAVPQATVTAPETTTFSVEAPAVHTTPEDFDDKRKDAAVSALAANLDNVTRGIKLVKGGQQAVLKTRICGGCSEVIVSGEFITAMGTTFHKQCFTCETCKEPLGGGFLVDDGKRSCKACVLSLGCIPCVAEGMALCYIEVRPVVHVVNASRSNCLFSFVNGCSRFDPLISCHSTGRASCWDLCKMWRVHFD
eukprot:m.467462 g.467462  ORF g.467462 m.467462 type:complete len:386 (-) comp21640_c0_seq4:684-1841(-)